METDKIVLVSSTHYRLWSP